MEKEDILDVELTLKKENVTALKWWGSKRLSYNLILVGVEIMILFIFWKGTSRYGIPPAILHSVFFTIAANVFYTLGWGTEFGIKYFHPTFQLSEERRLFLWLVGVLFSILVTFTMYTRALSYLQH